MMGIKYPLWCWFLMGIELGCILVSFGWYEMKYFSQWFGIHEPISDFINANPQLDPYVNVFLFVGIGIVLLFVIEWLIAWKDVKDVV